MNDDRKIKFMTKNNLVGSFLQKTVSENEGTAIDGNKKRAADMIGRPK